MRNLKPNSSPGRLLLGLILLGALALAGCGQKSELFLPDPTSGAVIEAGENEPEDGADDEC